MIHGGRKNRPYDLGFHTNLGRSGRCRRLLPCITWRKYVNCLITWNVRGINGIAKRKEVMDIFKEGRFELLALTETKLKGNGDHGLELMESLPVFRRWKELGKGWPSC